MTQRTASGDSIHWPDNVDPFSKLASLGAVPIRSEQPNSPSHTHTASGDFLFTSLVGETSPHHSQASSFGSVGDGSRQHHYPPVHQLRDLPPLPPGARHHQPRVVGDMLTNLTQLMMQAQAGGVASPHGRVESGVSSDGKHKKIRRGCRGGRQKRKKTGNSDVEGEHSGDEGESLNGSHNHESSPSGTLDGLSESHNKEPSADPADSPILPPAATSPNVETNVAQTHKAAAVADCEAQTQSTFTDCGVQTDALPTPDAPESPRIPCALGMTQTRVTLFQTSGTQTRPPTSMPSVPVEESTTVAEPPTPKPAPTVPTATPTAASKPQHDRGAHAFFWMLIGMFLVYFGGAAYVLFLGGGLTSL